MISKSKGKKLPRLIINNTILSLEQIIQNVRYQDELLLKKLDQATEKYWESRNINNFQQISDIYNSDILKKVENQRNKVLANLNETLKQYKVQQTQIRQRNQPIIKDLKNKGQFMDSKNWIHYEKVLQKLSQSFLLQDFNFSAILRIQSFRNQIFTNQIEAQANYLLCETQHFLLECDQIFEDQSKQEQDNSFLTKLKHTTLFNQKIDCLGYDIFDFAQQDFKKNQQVQHSFISTNVDTIRNQDTAI